MQEQIETEAINVGKFIVNVPKTTNLSEFANKINEDPDAIDLYQLEQQGNNIIPTQAERQASYNFDRSQGKSEAPYQIAVRAERQALKSGIAQHWADKYANATNVSKEAFMRLIDYLPNARFAYLNMVIKKGLGGLAEDRKTLKQGDLDFINTIWMSEENKELLKRVLLPATNTSEIGFTIRPTWGRSGIRFQDGPGDKLIMKLRNPGNVSFQPQNISSNSNNYVQNNSASETLLREVTTSLNNDIMKLGNESHKYCQDNEFLEDTLSIDQYFKNSSPLNIVLLHLKKLLARNRFKIDDLKKLMVKINDITAFKKSLYLEAISNPFKIRSARIPTLLSPPSATFSVRSVTPLTTNALGNVAFAFAPFYLTNAIQSSFGVNNDVGLTGVGPSGFFIARAVGQQLPAAFYVRYRLVSAGLRVYCFPSSNNDNGLLTVSTTFEDIGVTNVGNSLTNATQFGDFSAIENGYYKKTTTIASRDVQEHTYIPIDDSFWDYQDVGTANSGMAWLGYISGGQPSSNIARVEFVSNYEALLDNTYTDYLPSDSPTDDLDLKVITPHIQRIKSDLTEAITPRKVKDILSEINGAVIPDGEVDLGQDPELRNKAQAEAKLLIDKFMAKMKNIPQHLPHEDRMSMIEKLSQYLKPIMEIAGMASTVLPYVL